MEALEVWPENNAVAHSCLQCLVALCKDNAMMKANVTVAALRPVIRVLQEGGARYAIAERGFTLLAVLQVLLRRIWPCLCSTAFCVKLLHAHVLSEHQCVCNACCCISASLRSQRMTLPELRGQREGNGGGMSMHAMACSSRMCSNDRHVSDVLTATHAARRLGGTT